MRRSGVFLNPFLLFCSGFPGFASRAVRPWKVREAYFLYMLFRLRQYRFQACFCSPSVSIFFLILCSNSQLHRRTRGEKIPAILVAFFHLKAILPTLSCLEPCHCSETCFCNNFKSERNFRTAVPVVFQCCIFGEGVSRAVLPRSSCHQSNFFCICEYKKQELMFFFVLQVWFSSFPDI